LNDGGVESERRTRFKTAVTKGPFVEEWIAKGEEDGKVLFEFCFEGDRVFGLGAGYLFESPTVSLKGDQRFENDPLRICVLTLNGEGELVSEEKEVCSLVDASQVTARINWIHERIRAEITSGQVAWEKRAEFFPNLRFCLDAAKALQALSGTEPFFYQICRHLSVMNSFCAAWPTGGIDAPNAMSEITWSYESVSTINSDRLRGMREFNCPDGLRRLFSPHSKPTGGNIRIHFRPVPEQKQILIGYIGPHLPY
jgi:hypothetical protein